MSTKAQNNKQLEALLEFYAANGVDCALDEMPHDRFADTQKTANERAKTTAGSTPKTLFQAPPQKANNKSSEGGQPIIAPKARQAVPESVALEDARKAAQQADTLEALRAALEAFDGCTLKRTAKSLVFGAGNPNARILFIGEAPGREEDINGIPFAGQAGELLNKMLASIGLNRDEDVYITNVVPWRPPGNRAATPQETELCRPFIERQIELVNPDILVPLGAPASRQLLQTQDGIMKLHGKQKPYALKTREIVAIPTFHPDYLLSQPGQKRLAWQDLLKIKQQLADSPSDSE